MIAYRYSFSDDIDLTEVESTLLLATMACESLHGAANVRLDARHLLDRDQRQCVIDADTPVGSDLARLFTGYAIREFGEEAFQVERMSDPASSQPSIAVA